MGAHLSGIPDALSDAIRNLLPADPNFKRVRETGGTENKVGELEGASTDELEFAAVNAPFDDLRLERAQRYDTQKTRQLFWPDELDVVANDRVVDLVTGTAYKVTGVMEFNFEGTPIGWRAELEEQTD